MLNLFKTTSAVVVTLASLGLLASVVQASSTHVQEAGAIHVQEAGAIHVQEAGAIHVQEAERQRLESANLETVDIDGEIAHIF